MATNNSLLTSLETQTLLDLGLDPYSKTLKSEISQKLKKLETKNILEKENFTPEDLLDYIYGVLHDLEYRQKYNDLLKSDFPKLPYPSSKENFWQFVKIGSKLRKLHLMEDLVVNDYITTYPQQGNDMIEKIKKIEDKVYINETQYFGGVPDEVWNFYIGGYQPAQKYLKDRKDKQLTNDEIDQYQRIIKVLSETIKIMNLI